MGMEDHYDEEEYDYEPGASWRSSLPGITNYFVADNWAKRIFLFIGPESLNLKNSFCNSANLTNFVTGILQ